MKVKTIIDRLKAQTTSFGGRVSGTAEFEEQVTRDAADFGLPCAFVMPLDEGVTDDLTAGPVTQVITERYGIVVCVSNATDPRGFTGGEALDDVKTDLFAALLGWQADADHAVMDYAGARHLAMDRARLWHQFDFTTTLVISSS